MILYYLCILTSSIASFPVICSMSSSIMHIALKLLWISAANASSSLGLFLLKKSGVKVQKLFGLGKYYLNSIEYTLRRLPKVMP